MSHDHISPFEPNLLLSSIMPWVGCAHDIFLLILDGKVAMPATLLQLPHVLDTTRLDKEGGGSLKKQG